jgi:hypothetical protein
MPPKIADAIRILAAETLEGCSNDWSDSAKANEVLRAVYDLIFEAGVQAERERWERWPADSVNEAAEAALAAYKAHEKTEMDREYGGRMCSECGWQVRGYPKPNIHPMVLAIDAALAVVTGKGASE